MTYRSILIFINLARFYQPDLDLSQTIWEYYNIIDISSMIPKEYVLF